jgi:formylmethanofuran dehydrogenase subunit C
MIAGTLIVLKDCGLLPGYLMRRGTIVLANAPELSPTFADCGVHELAFAKVFAGTWRPLEKAKSFFPRRISSSLGRQQRSTRFLKSDI